MLALVRIFSASSFIISPVLSIKSCKPLSLFFHKGIVYMILFRYTYHALSVNSSYRICISMSCAMITFIWQPGYPDLLFRGCMPFNSLTFLFIRCITAWISASLALIFMIAIMLSLVFIITVVLWLINTWCKLENRSIYKFIDNLCNDLQLILSTANIFSYIAT